MTSRGLAHSLTSRGETVVPSACLEALVVLDRLTRAGPVAAAKVAYVLHQTPHVVMQKLARLREAGLVERVSHQQWRVACRFIPAGVLHG